MSKQRVNELGAEIRRLQVEIAEKAQVDMDVSNLQTAFNAKLLELINTALDSEEMVEKLFNLLEKSG